MKIDFNPPTDQFAEMNAHFDNAWKSVHERLIALAKSACTKQNEYDLTSDEKAALCFAAGIRSEPSMNGHKFTMSYPRCGFIKTEIGWNVVTL